MLNMSAMHKTVEIILGSAFLFESLELFEFFDKAKQAKSVYSVGHFHQVMNFDIIHPSSISTTSFPPLISSHAARLLATNHQNLQSSMPKSCLSQISSMYVLQLVQELRIMLLMNDLRIRNLKLNYNEYKSNISFKKFQYITL